MNLNNILEIGGVEFIIIFKDKRATCCSHVKRYDEKEY
jgi:hypothetical protein